MSKPRDLQNSMTEMNVLIKRANPRLNDADRMFEILNDLQVTVATQEAAIQRLQQQKQELEGQIKEMEEKDGQGK